MSLNEIDKRLENFETALPAVVTNVNGDGSVDVALSIRKVALNGVIDTNPIDILSVPVLKAGTRNFCIKLPIKAGDPIILIAISRDSSLWKASEWGENDVIPKSCSGNTLCDFVAIQMNFWKSSNDNFIEIAEDGHVIFNADVEINGKVMVDKSIEAESVKAEGNVEAGNVLSNGNVKAMGDLQTSILSFSTHVHECAAPGYPSLTPESPPPT